jgi:YVTN family beta-propeller protein
MVRRGRALHVVAALALAACSSSPVSQATPSAHAPATVHSSATPKPAPSRTPASTPKPAVGSVLGTTGAGIYAYTTSGHLSPLLAGLTPRVYVPNEGSGTVVVIDPRTFAIIGRFWVGNEPEHVTPDWDLKRLYVNDMLSDALTVIDPRTAKPIRTISVPIPYNLYFTPDGSKAIVVEDSKLPGSVYPNGLRFYDRATWKFLKFVSIPFPGADHLDFTADGRYLFISCEYSGEVERIDTRTMQITGGVRVGGLPIDVRLAPAGDVFFVANQGSGGVSVVDPVKMKVIGFIPTGNGAHGISLSRDATRLFVSNRLAGTISVISIATRHVIATWIIGGTPDMMTLSPDGIQLWVSNRYSGTVTVIDTRSGRVLAVIRTGVGPHGLSFWPQPGRFSLGHNGNMR